MELALAQGYRGLRLTEEITGNHSESPIARSLVEYEARLNQLLPGTCASVMCQYNRHRFSPDILSQVLQTHPLVIHGAAICENPYYRLPEMVLSRRLAGQGEIDLCLNLIGERKRLEQEWQRHSAELQRKLTRQTAYLEARVQELTILNEVALTASQSLRLEEMLEVALDKLMRVANIDACWVRLLDEERGELNLVAQLGWSPEVMQEAEVLKLGEGICGRAAENGQTIVSQAPSEDPRVATAVPRKEGWQCFACIPLKAKNKTVGVLGVASRKRGWFDVHRVRFFEALAGHLAPAVENAKLYRKVERERDNNALLYRNSAIFASFIDEETILQELVQKMLREFGADWSAVFLPDESHKVLRVVAEASQALEYSQAMAAALTREPLKIEEGIEGQVFSSGEPFLAKDYTWLPRVPQRFLEAGIRSGFSVPISRAGERLGVLSVISFTPFRHSEEQLHLAQTVATVAGTSLINARLYRQQSKSKAQLEAQLREIEAKDQQLIEAYQSMVHSLMLTLEAKDPYTRGHSDRTRHWCREMGYRLGLTPSEIAALDQAAELHDLGKIGMPDALLRKPGALAPPEWAQVRLHPEKTVELLRQLPFLRPCLAIIRAHHERYDGTGYPDRLAGEEIPLGARILAVADSYDAMTSERPYRPPFTHEEAVEKLKQGAGTQWDPRVVATFLEVLSSWEQQKTVDT
jgi:HD-GYP domain-containing protein (c-di-GMP phosphodiesterase class II)